MHSNTATVSSPPRIGRERLRASARCGHAGQGAIDDTLNAGGMGVWSRASDSNAGATWHKAIGRT